MNAEEKWVIEDHWGYTRWGVLDGVVCANEDEALATIEAVRKHARESKNPASWAYRTIPLRAVRVST